jgi:hypothetical protein
MACAQRTHIGGNVARQAVEMLEKSRNVPRLVDVLVDASVETENSTINLLNHGAGDRDRTGDIQLGKLAFYR